MSFEFQRAAELLHTTSYLFQFDDTIKFKLGHESRRTTLQVSTVHVPPFSYTTVDFTNDVGQRSKVAAVEPVTLTWAVNTVSFTNVLRCFDPLSPLTMEVADDVACVLLYQTKADGGGVQVAQVGALHDLGPRLLVDHDVRELYTVADTRSFADVVRSVCTSDDDRCYVELRRTSSRECELTMRTSSVTASLRLRLDEEKSAVKHLVGSARCEDLHAFVHLCLRTAAVADSGALMVGFGSDGIALFRTQWFTESGPRVASLFFCAA